MKRIRTAIAKEFFNELTLQAHELHKLSNFYCLKGDQKSAEYYADCWDETLSVRDTLAEAYPACSQPYNLVDRLILLVRGMFRS